MKPEIETMIKALRYHSRDHHGEITKAHTCMLYASDMLFLMAERMESAMENIKIDCPATAINLLSKSMDVSLKEDFI